jgi:hypothetical protein
MLERTAKHDLGTCITVRTSDSNAEPKLDKQSDALPENGQNRAQISKKRTLNDTTQPQVMYVTALLNAFLAEDYRYHTLLERIR